MTTGEMVKSTVGVRNLKARLSEYLKGVSEGDVIEITSRGEMIAANLERQGFRDDPVCNL